MSTLTATATNWRFDAIGTSWEIASSEPISDGQRALVTATIDAFDREWSRFRNDSLVASLARGAGVVDAPPDAKHMLDLYAEVSDATSGAVQPLVGDALAALGYDAAYSLTPGTPAPAPEDWRQRLAWSADRLVLTTPSTIDVGAIGKGRLVDLVADTVAPLHGHVVVDAGGDIAVRGTSIRVGLEDPFDAGRAIGVVEVRDGAICASATNRRAWRGLHHVLDARTGMPVRSVVATWAFAPTAMLADAASSALFFAGGDRFAFDRGVEWVRVLSDGRVEWSPSSPAVLLLP